jgi:acyl carrier protein
MSQPTVPPDLVGVVADVVARHVDDGTVPRADAELSALGLNSLGLAELIVDLEQVLAMEFPEYLLERETFSTVRTIADAVEKVVVEARIREYILDGLGGVPDEGKELPADYPLLAGGILDSLDIYNLIVYLEGAFGIKVDDAELLPDNFSSIGAIARLVTRKR